MGINVAKKILLKAKMDAKRQDKRRVKRQDKRLVKRQAKRLNKTPVLTSSTEK